MHRPDTPVSPADRGAAPNLLVAVAWPYANGPLHAGHVAGSLLAPDIFARYHRMRGHRVLMVSGSDMHGTPITVTAEHEGLDAAVVARRNNVLHQDGLRALDVHFDLFTSTATPNHRDVVHEVFLALHRAGCIDLRTVTAPFDPAAGRFLPDRYVEGECPHCGHADARGDQCDACGRTLDPQDLVRPRSKLTGAPPEFRETEHFFLALSKLEPTLRAWAQEQAGEGGWRPAVRASTDAWFEQGLKDRAITRDLTYGVDVPPEVGAFPGKRIYVWFEAVVGYLSASIEWAKRRGEPDAWRAFWAADGSARAFYFLGKDNTPFHTILWPAILEGYARGDGDRGRLALPWDVVANEFLQLGERKLSKSRGVTLGAIELAREFQADAVRYYLAANMPERGDTSFTFEEFVAKVNDELLAKIGNYANRVLVLCAKNWGGIPPGSAKTDAEHEAGRALRRASDDALTAEAAHLERREFRKALQRMQGLAADGNRALDASAPWSLVKRGEDGKARAATVLRAHLRVLRALAVGLHPFLPAMTAELYRQLGHARGESADLRDESESEHVGRDVWTAGGGVAAEGPLGTIAPLVQKLDRDAVLARFTEGPTPHEPRSSRPPATTRRSAMTGGDVRP